LCDVAVAFNEPVPMYMHEDIVEFLREKPVCPKNANRRQETLRVSTVMH